MISPGPDARDLAFAALLPLARPTAAALERVDRLVGDERKLMDPLRLGFTPALNAGVLGLGRFGYAVRELGAEWLDVPNVRRDSRAEQEAHNVHLWGLGDRFVVRIKREPVEGVAEGTQRLFAQLPAAGRPSTVFLTWDINLEGRISAPRFACIDEPKWTILLAELLADGAGPVISIPSAPKPSGPVVRSKIKAPPGQRDEG